MQQCLLGLCFQVVTNRLSILSRMCENFCDNQPENHCTSTVHAWYAEGLGVKGPQFRVHRTPHYIARHAFFWGGGVKGVA